MSHLPRSWTSTSSVRSWREDYFEDALAGVLEEEHAAARLFRCNALGLRSSDLASVRSNHAAGSFRRDAGVPMPHDELVERVDVWEFKPSSELFDDGVEPSDEPA